MKKRQCDRSHRSKERDECATKGRLAWKRLRSQSEEQLGDISAIFLKECCRAHRPDANDRERCKGERQTPIGGRNVARAAIAREPEGTWTTGGRLEDGSLQRTTGQVNASCTAFFI